MNRISNILVIVDPTATQHPAVVKGAILAEQLDARLELFACDTKASREARMAAHLLQPRAPYTFNLKALLEELAEPPRGRGIDVITQTQCAEPLHAALADRTKSTRADLVIKDTHHHSIARRTFLTNTDWELIRSCPAPLLLTKATTWSKRPRILAAVDPGHADDKPAYLDHEILEYAAYLVHGLNGELHAAHAYMPVAIIAAATSGTPPMATMLSADDLAAEEQSKRKEITALAAAYATDPANVHVQVGSAVEFLPRIATSLQIDIVTMGTISRSGLKRVFIGNTAERVLERLPCDVLVIKPPNFAALLAVQVPQ